MIRKIKTNISLFYINTIIYSLSILTLNVNAETKIIAKSGDTLLKISKQYGISLKELMYKNNFNDATRIVEGKTIVIPLKSNYEDIKADNLTYKVVEGDTLYKIARDFNVKLKDIIAINNLENNSFLELGQIIIIPHSAIYKEVISKKNIEMETVNKF